MSDLNEFSQESVVDPDKAKESMELPAKIYGALKVMNSISEAQRDALAKAVIKNGDAHQIQAALDSLTQSLARNGHTRETIVES